MSEPAKLKDVLQYTPESYFSKEELDLIKRTFKDSPQLVRVIRKVFLPTISDPNLPIEEFSKDVYLAGKSWASIPVSERATLMVGRQEAIEFVLGGLMFLKNLAQTKEETEEEEMKRRKQDSAK